MKQVIRMDKVTKKHDGDIVVQALNLAIHQGDVVGFIGEKKKRAVLMQLLSGEITPCEGDIYYGNTRLGLYGQTPEYVGIYISPIGFLCEFDGFKNLKYIAGMNERAGEEEIVRSMEFVGLNPSSRLKVEKFSKRMIQKLSVAQAIMEGQEILLLDADLFTKENEENHNELKKIIRKLKKYGITIVLTSEKEEYVQNICTNLYQL